MRPMRRSHFQAYLPGPGLRAPAALVLALATLVGPAAASASAQTLADYDYDHLTFRGVGFGAGYMWSNRIEDTEQYTLRFDLGYLGPGVRIIPSVAYWSSELTQAEIDKLATRISQHSSASVLGDNLAPIQWSDISLSVDAHFVWSAPLGFLAYVGTGVGLHALNGQGPAVDDTFVEDLMDDITAGVSGIAGFEVEPIRRVRLYLEGRYTAMSSLSFATARGGIQIMFSSGGVEVGAVEPPAAPATGRAP